MGPGTLPIKEDMIKSKGPFVYSQCFYDVKTCTIKYNRVRLI